VDILMYLLLGMGVGVLSGFFGIGGGFILTPILLLLNFSPVTAVATGLLYTIGTSLSGVIAHFRLQNIQWKTAFIIGISGVFATQLAYPFVLLLENFHVADTVIPICYLLLIIYFAYSLFKKEGPNTKPTSDVQEFNLYKAIFIGLFAGFVSTTLGVGGGFIIVPLLISVLSYRSRYAVGTSLLSVFMIVAAGFSAYASSTPIDFKVSGSLIIGALIGGQIGAIFTAGFTDQKIRRYLGTLYSVTGVSLLLKLVHLGDIGLLLLLAYSLFLVVHFSIRTIKIRLSQQTKLASK
jgi:uncharacterized protein